MGVSFQMWDDGGDLGDQLWDLLRLPRRPCFEVIQLEVFELRLDGRADVGQGVIDLVHA